MNQTPHQPQHVTATLVLAAGKTWPLEDLGEDDLRQLIARSAILFGTATDGVTPEALAAGADPSSWAGAEPPRRRPAVTIDHATLEAWLRDFYKLEYAPLFDFDGDPADVAELVQALHDEREGTGWRVVDGISAIHATVTADGAVIISVDVSDQLRLASIPQEAKAFLPGDEQRARMDGRELAVYALECVAYLVDETWQAYRAR